MTEDEIDSLSPGSVIRYGERGTLRVIRHIYHKNHDPDSKVIHVQCIKQKCSQYCSPFTEIDRHFLRHHCETTGARLRLDSNLDKAIMGEVGKTGSEHDIDQCEVVGNS